MLDADNAKSRTLWTHVVHTTLLLSVLLVTSIATGQDESIAAKKPPVAEDEAETKESTSDLPTLDDLPKPTATEILQQPPVDWVIIEKDRVFRVAPVRPRPETMGKMQARVEAFAKTKPVTSDVAKINKWREQFERVHDVEMTLIDDPLAQPYWLHIKHIDGIVHHETHAIDAAAKLRDAGDYSTARELLEHVRRRAPEWPGLFEADNELLFADAQSMLRSGALEQALVTFERLHERFEEFPLLEIRIGQTVRAIAQRALANDEPRSARYFTERLRRLYPNHAVLGQIDAARRAQANQFLKAAEASASEREASELIREVARYAPETKRLRSAHEKLFNRYPILHVGTMTSARPSRSDVVRPVASRRYEELTSSRLFEPDSVEGDLVRYRSRFVESWRPEDLERRAVLTLSPDVAGLDAYVLADRLADAIESPIQYGERWYGSIIGVRPTSPKRLELDLGHGPLRLDALLGQLELDLPARFEQSPLPETSRDRWTTSTGFRSTTTNGSRPRGQFAELIEHEYDTAEAFGRAIRRDEIDLAVDVPPHIVSRLAQESWFAKEVILNRATLPTTHVLQFRGGSVIAASTPLRVALERGINRPRVLAEQFLREADLQGLGAEYARLTNTPFPRFSYANRPTMTTRPQDPAAAIPLALLAKHQLGDRWRPLRMIAPATPEVRDAAAQMVSQWRSINLPVELVAIAETETAVERSDWDIAYRVLAVTEPSLELWRLLATDGVVRTSSIEYLPEPMRQRLTRLDNTRDWPTAAKLLGDAHQALVESALIIPLWEIDRLSIRRRAIRGVPDDCLTPYHGLERWRVEAAYSTQYD